MIPEADMLKMVVSENAFSEFLRSLQNGFYVKSPEGISVKDFLTEICGITEEYIEENVKTVFINNKPADKLHQVFIVPDMICALSGAMPGLVGAMMRMGSFYSVLREGITCDSPESGKSGDEVLVKIKLFNKILYDKGPEFLFKGIYADRADLISLLESGVFENEISEMEINKKKMKKVILNNLSIEFKSHIIYYRVEVIGNS